MVLIQNYVSESHIAIEILDLVEIPQTNEHKRYFSVPTHHSLVKTEIMSLELAEIFTPFKEVINLDR